MNKFYPKKPVRTFRDLDVYQQTLASSVTVSKALKAPLARVRYPLAENLINCALSIPFYIGEAHSLRFGDHARSIRLLEHAMAGCNKMVIYLEQVSGLYGDKLDADTIAEVIKRYLAVRTKIFRLERSWQKFDQVQRNLGRTEINRATL